MAKYSGPTDNITTGADLSAATNIGLGITTAGTVAGAAGADLFGIIIDGGRDNGDQALVALPGNTCRGRAGAAFSAGDMLTTDASGRLIAANAANDIVIARAKQAATGAGQLVDVRVTDFESVTGAP